ncbi:hypothetical protein A2U01_0058295, partial [Trifolium medium]|nr:hypothetical protein [Trifolium medium]
VQVSPVKKRQDSSDSEDDQPVSEDKDTIGTEGAPVAQVVRGKEPIVSGATAATAPKKKRAGKDKIEEVVTEKEKRKKADVSESDKEKVIKKPRTQKKKEPKSVRKWVIQEDDEETDDEPLQIKRKRTEP